MKHFTELTPTFHNWENLFYVAEEQLNILLPWDGKYRSR